ncbi:hypothetical protein ADUPG1_010476 [Aduncisulcus paluster]|uniref:RING-type domain-containing protein n=1 Tax=Aduncisulcus paluster TaxID=2918883 RepID=A0ABQ5JUG9_9EUKA|nr:hypothetical protein ADUPG1_010476 [Aduncisulcus paluster]
MPLRPACPLDVPMYRPYLLPSEVAGRTCVLCLTEFCSNGETTYEVHKCGKCTNLMCHSCFLSNKLETEIESVYSGKRRHHFVLRRPAAKCPICKTEFHQTTIQGRYPTESYQVLSHEQMHAILDRSIKPVPCHCHEMTIPQIQQRMYAIEMVHVETVHSSSGTGHRERLFEMLHPAMQAELAISEEDIPLNREEEEEESNQEEEPTHDMRIALSS